VTGKTIELLSPPVSVAAIWEMIPLSGCRSTWMQLLDSSNFGEASPAGQGIKPRSFHG